jgi:cytochrome o ubiquinol oxidase operon protein cyoD
MSDHAAATTKKSVGLWSYVIGFILSVSLTLLAYWVVTTGLVTGVITLIILGLAGVQLLVQLIFFLHLGREDRPHWNLVFLLSCAGIIMIVVIGSVWIMNHLNYLMMPSSQMDQQIMDDENIQR